MSSVGSLHAHELLQIAGELREISEDLAALRRRRLEELDALSSSGVRSIENRLQVAAGRLRKEAGT